MDLYLILQVIFSFLSILFLYIGYITGSSFLLFLAPFCLILFVALYCFNDFSKRVSLLLFNFSFLIFALGRPIAIYFLGYEVYEEGIFGTSIEDFTTYKLFIILSFVSLSTIFLVFSFFERKDQYNGASKVVKYTNEPIYTTEWICKCAYYILFVIHVFVIYDRIKFVSTGDFFQQYLNYESSIPTVFHRLAETSSVPFFILLSSGIPFRRLGVPIALFMIEAILLLMAGRRMMFVLNIFILIVFFVKRNNYRIKKLNLKYLILLGTVALSVIIVSNFVYLKRMGYATEINNPLSEFLYKQGVTLKTILIALENQSIFDFKFYSAGTIIEFLKNNPLTQSLFHFPVYTGQTAERALNSHLFSHRISYEIDPHGYLNGRGYASSYLAESYIDFGFLGILVISCLIGFLLFWLYKNIGNSNLVKSAISFSLLQGLFIIPRSESSSFITSTFTLSNIVMMLFVIFIIKLMDEILKKRRGKI